MASSGHSSFKEGFLEEETINGHPRWRSTLLKSLPATEGEPMLGLLGGSFGGHSLCAVCGPSQPIWGIAGAGGRGAGTGPKRKGVRGSSLLISLSNPASCSCTQARKTGCVSRAPSPAYIHLCSRHGDPDTGQGGVESGSRPVPGRPSSAGTALGGLPAPTQARLLHTAGLPSPCGRTEPRPPAALDAEATSTCGSAAPKRHGEGHGSGVGAPGPHQPCHLTHSPASEHIP